MIDECLTENDLLALLANDASLDAWRAHLESCAECRDALSKQERLQDALSAGPSDAAVERLVRSAHARLNATLAARARRVAYYDTWEKSPVGRIFVAVSRVGLCAVGLHGGEEDFVRRLERRGFEAQPSREHVGDAISQLREYFEGRRKRFDLAVDLSGQTEFQRLVLEATATVEPGSVVTYGDVARRIGHPRACRAVGSALSWNPVPIVVPCHRVIGSDGGLHGYGGGLDLKAKLLQLEGIAVA
jgi:O-6-methylguanine DNA methyltransferase